MDIEGLLKAAEEARQASYSPYSRFQVGAALLTTSGALYTGANIENASYGLCICAERMAAGKAVLEGHLKFAAIACVGGDAMQSPKVYCAPCGACRQFLYEFATPETLIVGWNGAEVVSDRLFDLIPKAFGPQNLLEPGQ